MRVYIGPYKNWIGPFQIADYLKYFGVSDDRCHKIGKYWSNTWVNNVCTWIDSKRKRNIKVHIDHYDGWSMDSTLAYIIHPLLVRLKNNKQGSPLVDDEDVPESIRSTSAPVKENEWDIDDFHHQRWDYVIDEMIWAFEIINTNWESEYYDFTDSTDLTFEDNSDGTGKLLWKNPPKIDNESINKIQDRMNNAFRLFGKYYQALWN